VETNWGMGLGKQGVDPRKELVKKLHQGKGKEKKYFAQVKNTRQRSNNLRKKSWGTNTLRGKNQNKEKGDSGNGEEPVASRNNLSTQCSNPEKKLKKRKKTIREEGAMGGEDS